MENFAHGIRIFTPDDITIWASNDFRENYFHHEVFPMPGGTFIGLEPDYHWKVADEDSTLWKFDVITEIDRQGRELWSWSCWDHLSAEDYDTAVFADVPPGGLFDWTHCNGCPFDPADSSIYLSVRNLDRILKIAYPSGDVVWSMGTQMPSGDVDFGGNLEFYKQHAPQPLPNGNLMLFDNHWHGNNEFSRGIEIEIDLEREEPAQIVWEYRHEFSPTQGDCDRLPNGNTLIATGQSGNFYEVNPDGELLWRALTDFPVGTYRSERIADFYPQVFALVGPADSLLVARWRGEIQFKIYNIGSAPQVYEYQLMDSENWFRESRGSVEATPGDSAVLVFYGEALPEEGLDTLMLRVQPASDSDDAQAWSVIILPDPQTAVQNDDPHNDSGYGLTVTNSTPSTALIEFKLPNEDRVTLKLFDMQGRLVETLLDQRLPKGTHRLAVAGRDFPDGCYFVQMRSAERFFTERLTILR